MPFFHTLESVLQRSPDRVSWETLEASAIAVDECKIDLLRDILLKSTETVLVGPRDSGKTVTAKALGFKLLRENGFASFYGNARDLIDIAETVAEVQAYESVTKRTLFVLEDCHTSTNLMKVEVLLQRLSSGRQNTVLLLTTRDLGPEDSALRAIGEEGGIVKLNPEKLRVHIARNYIEQLRKQGIYTNSPHFPKDPVEVEAQTRRLLVKLPKKNLRILDMYLHAWDPRTGPLGDIEERQILQRLLTSTTPNLSSKEAQNCLLPLYAIDQYEVGVHINFFDRGVLQQLKDSGIVHCSDLTGLCRLPDPSEAPWYLRAAEQARLLQVEGQLTNVATYVKHCVLEYAAVAPNPQDLLRALRPNNRDLARQVILDRGFEANVKEVASEPCFRSDFPSLLFELRMLHKMDVCLQIARALTDNDLNEVGKLGLDTVGRYLGEFLSWTQDYRHQVREVAQRLTQQLSLQPQVLAREFMAGLVSGRYGVRDLATLLVALDRLGTYDIRGLLNALDLPQLKAKFPETRVVHYAALLRVIKHAKAGVDFVIELTPSLRMIHERVRGGSARVLRDMMDALLMPDRKRLWTKLGDKELREILSRSTLNQLYNFLEDAVESKNKESELLGREIATRLVNLNLSALMAMSDLTDVSMFVLAATTLNPELNKTILDQILQAGLEGIIKREKNKGRAVSKISLIQRDISSAPDVSSNFLRELTQLNLLPYIRASKTGLRYLTYGALMADKELSRKWFLDIGKQTWEDKIREASEDETFWLLWNFFQVEPALTNSLTSIAEIRDKIAGTPHGVGLLALCGVVTVGNAAIILPQLSNSLMEPWDASRLALTLRALSLPDLRTAALGVLASLDLVKVRETFQNADVLEQTKDLFMKILSEFQKLN